MKNYVLLVITIGLLFTMFTAVSAAEKEKIKYVGLSACKSCHQVMKIGGEEYKAFMKSDHANAYKTLLTEESKKIAQDMGIEDATKSDKCMKCHTTAWGKSKDYLGTKFKYEDGVTCEACHGAGEKYLKMDIMKDHELALKNGLVVPDAKSCIVCHNEESPTYKKFDYATKWKIIKHGEKEEAK